MVMMLLIAMCVAVVVVMVVVVKGLRQLLLDNEYVFEARLAESLRESLQRSNPTGWKPVAPLPQSHHRCCPWPLQPSQPSQLPQPLLPHWLEACCVSLWAMTARGPAHGREGFTVSLC